MILALIDYFLIFILGVLAGVINILAGGGSNIILPVLMIMGLPADVANGTNRLGIFMQSLVGLCSFHKAGRLPTQDLKNIFLPSLLGGLVGAVIASFAPEIILKPLLLITMLSMAAIMMIKPSIVLPELDIKPYLVKEHPQAFLWLFLAGMYGGFVQAGVGFVLLTVLAGSLRYDLVSANALKIICTIFFTTIALLVFIWRGQVWWLTGFALALGNMLGAAIGVRLAVKVKPIILKQILFIMTLVAVIAALVF